MSIKKIGRKTPLKRTVISRFSLIIFLVILLTGVLSVSLIMINDLRDDISDYNAEKFELLKSSISHRAWSTSLLSYITLGDEFNYSIEENFCSFDEIIANQAIASDPSYSDFIALATPIHSDLENARDEILSVNPSDQQKMIELYTSGVQPLIQAFDNQVVSQSELLDEIIAQKELKIHQLTPIIVVVCVTIIFGIVSLCFYTYLYLKKHLIRPLIRFEEEAGKLSRGDLNLDFSTDSNIFEIYDLSTTLGTSSSELNRMISEVSVGVGALAQKDFSVYPQMTFPGEFSIIETCMAKLIDEVRLIMNQIKIAVNSVDSEVNALSNGAITLAQGSTEQASSIQELSENTDAIMSRIEETAKNAQAVNDLGKTVNEVLSESSDSMKQLMDSIAQTQSSAMDIQKIIKTIDDIAFQTNILALNAAVEAARAGQAGKGFAVVADEVRDLAQKAAEAASNTAVLINNSISLADRSGDFAGNAQEAFDKVQNHTRNVLSTINDIASDTEKQAHDARQISTGLNHISEVVHANSSTSQQNAATSQNLSSQAGALAGLVGQFKLTDDQQPTQHDNELTPVN